MHVQIEQWLNLALKILQERFGKRLLFVGLQGSYNRGEATPDSDIDLVVVLDELQFKDLKIYRSIIERLPYKEKACGFISGKKEIENWSKSDLFQFFYDTKPLVGKLEDIIQPPDVEDIKNSIKTSAETLYHSAVHSFVHSVNYTEDLQNLYKIVFFVLQAEYFVKIGDYIPTKRELLECLEGIDREILNVCINRKEINNMESEILYKQLIDWSREKLV